MRSSLNLVLSTSAFALSVGLASPAFAQAVEPPVCAPGQTENCTPVEVQADAAATAPVGTVATQDGGSDQPIVVTGSRIRRPNLESNVPIDLGHAPRTCHPGRRQHR